MCTEGMSSRYRLRVALQGNVGTAVDSEFSDRLIDAALSSAYQRTARAEFARPQPFPVVSGIDDPAVNDWPMDELAECVEHLSIIYPTLRVIEVAAERERVEIVNSMHLHGTYTHSLVKLVIDQAHSPSTFYWRSKPSENELIQCFRQRPDLKMESWTGVTDTIFTPQAASVLVENCFSEDVLRNTQFPACLTIFDDPVLKGGIGSRPFDDLGYACMKTPVVSGGRVVTTLPEGPGFYTSDDDGQLTSRWNHLVVMATTRDILSSFTGIVIDHVENIGGSWKIRGYRYDNGLASTTCAPALIHEPSCTLLERLTATGNDPMAHPTVQSPSLRIDNVRIEPSPFSV